MAEPGLRMPLSNTFSQAFKAKKLATLALLFILLTIATASISSILIGAIWSSLWQSLIIGLLVGWWLAVFRRPAWLAGLITITTGIIYTCLFTNGVDSKVIALVQKTIHFFASTFYSPKSGLSNFSTLILFQREATLSIRVVFERVFGWISALIVGQPIFDPVATAFIWGMLIWIVAGWAGWIVEAKKNALLAGLPIILVSVGALSYRQQMSSTIYLMLGLTLVLVALVRHDQCEQEWDEIHIAYPAHKSRQIGNTAVLMAILLVTLSAVISNVSFQRISNWLAEIRNPSSHQDNNLAKSLGILPHATASPDTFEAVRRPGLPRGLLIGSGPELSKRVVMSVAIEYLQTLSQGEQPVPFYWRSFTYDVYTGNGWRTSETEQTHYQSGQPLQQDHALEHIQIKQIVRPVEEADGVIYAAGEPVKLNLDSDVAWRSSNDLFGIQAEGSRSYEIYSLIPVVDENSLRKAGQKYPEWVRQRYLPLPPNVPDRVKNLAIELTATESSPYERVKTIEKFLRTFPYTLDVPRPPLEQDVVDFFLFDLRKGYCDYYASAMVVLARAAGVPARLAIGYASGTYNLNLKRFEVTEADAHSWAEVYFPNIGWISFEPTAAKPALERSGNQNPELQKTTISSEMKGSITKTNSKSRMWLFLPGIFGSAIILSVAWAVFEEIRECRLSDQAKAVDVYMRMKRYRKSLASTWEPGETPYELAALLETQLQDQTYQGIHPTFRLHVIEDTRSIIDGIVKISYNPAQPTGVSKFQTWPTWKSLRWRLSLLWIYKGWKSFRNHFNDRSININK